MKKLVASMASSLAVVVGCGADPMAGADGASSSGGSGVGADPAAGGSSSGPGGASSSSSSSGGAATACGAAAAVCTGWNTRATCTDSGGKATWTDETCPAGQGCVRGACAPWACSDECRLGEAGCRLYDASTGKDVAADPKKTHDRARLFERWIRADTRSLFHDQIVSVRYTDASRASVGSMYIGDSALHTGVYLAAESHRLRATGSALARKNVRAMVDLYHRLFNVSGDPGMLASSIFPAGDQELRDYTGWDCKQFDRHCGVTYDGKKWDYVGDPSRDMYMGPLLGLVQAYDALGTYDEARRALIRKDLLVLAKELAKKRTIPVRLVVNGQKLPVENKEARFFLPETADMVDGAVEIQVDLGSLDGGAIRGGQEMMPDPAVFFRQFPILGSVPSTPRAGSALMAGGVFAAALHVTEGVPEHAADRAALADFVKNGGDAWGNAKTWIDLAAQWQDHKEDCSEKYFGLHIGWIGGYVWSLYEKDPAIRAELSSKVVEAKLWSDVAKDKNSFFSFGYDAMKPGGLTGASLADATRQVESFPAPPRVRVGKSGACSTTAAEIADRPVVFLSWHTNPWNRSDAGNTSQTYPGHDYLVAYWMGRTGGQIADDTPARCLRR